MQSVPNQTSPCHTRTSSSNKTQLSSVTTSSKTHPLLLHLCFPAWLQNLSWKIASAGQTHREGVLLFLLPLLPLFTLHWSAASRVQYNQSYTQTQWHCPPHGSLSNTGIRTLGKPTRFRQTALLPSLSALFFFSYSSASLSFTVPTLHSLSLSPSPLLSLVCQDCLYFWKSSTSPSLAGMKQTTSAAGGLLQLCSPPSNSIMKHNQYSAD